MALRNAFLHAEQQSARAARRGMNRVLAALHAPVICVHDDEEQEPNPIHASPIVSVNGEDIEHPGPRRGAILSMPDRPQDR